MKENGLSISLLIYNYWFKLMYLQGMGEPLQNIENVIKAADIMVHEQGLHFSPRKVTVSTSGLVPQLKCFLHESNCALAVSLNATTDEVYYLQLYVGVLKKHTLD